MQQLKSVEALDFKYVIGGHGDTLVGKDRCVLWRTYFDDLLAETSKAAAQSTSLEDVKSKVVPILLDKYGSQFSPDFAKTVVANVETSYRVPLRETTRWPCRRNGWGNGFSKLSSSR
jgi:hypothetical protein